VSSAEPEGKKSAHGKTLKYEGFWCGGPVFFGLAPKVGATIAKRLGAAAPVLFSPLLRGLRRRPAPAGEAALKAALRPWERRLAFEAIERWLMRGTIGALVLASLVLVVGWVTPYPESELRPWAVQFAVPPLLAALLLSRWPATRLRNAAVFDTRLGFGDRLATAWTYRHASQSIVQLQRADAIALLEKRSPRTDLIWRPGRIELAALGASALIALFLLITPSPQQAVLDRQTTEQAAVQQASDRLEALRQEATNAPSLTPEQAQRLNELLQQAQIEINRVRTQKEATTILARTQDQLSAQLADPNSDLRDEALAAMSETLAAEPLSRQLGDAIQHEDAQATSDAVKALTQQADQLSDIQRQALSRALQRAANVGRSDPRSASALREAARAIGAGESSEAALSSTEAALRDAIQAATAQASLRSTAQRLRDLEAQLASGGPLSDQNVLQKPGVGGAGDETASPSGALAINGTPVAVDAGGRALLKDPSAERGSGAGVGAGSNLAGGGQSSLGQAAENVFVPGRAGSGVADQDLIDQPFTVRGAPRPYRDVLGQYAQSGRDYVDRPDVSPAVRDMVKQYFQQLEEGQ
jgi:hypothetical protein